MARYTAAQALQLILGDEYNSHQVNDDYEFEFPLTDEMESNHGKEANNVSCTEC